MDLIGNKEPDPESPDQVPKSDNNTEFELSEALTAFDENETRRKQHYFLYVVIILIVLSIIGFAVLLRGQSLSIAVLSESVANISSTVRDLTFRLTHQRKAEITATGEKVFRLASFASDYCVEQGGQLAIAKRPGGGEYGLCLFGPDRQCEEWSLLDGGCPVGGIDITKFGNPADVYCSVTGNEVIGSILSRTGGKCRVEGTVCSATSFYNTGDCASD